MILTKTARSDVASQALVIPDVNHITLLVSQLFAMKWSTSAEILYGVPRQNLVGAMSSLGILYVGLKRRMD